MKFEKVVYGLNSERRRQILRFLSEDNLSAPEIYQMMGDNAPVYRQSINKSLDILEGCGLIEKYYDNNKKAICYRLVKKSLTLRLDNLSIE